MQLKSFESRLFFALVAGISAIFFWMTKAFLMPVFWATVLAVLFRPVYLRLLRASSGRAALASFLATVAVIFVALIPAALILTSMAQQALGLYAEISSGRIDLMAPVGLVERHLPSLMLMLQEYGVELEQIRNWVRSGAVILTQWAAGQTLTIGQNIVSLSILFVLMLYLLFFFFRDGDQLIQTAIRVLPIGDERERRLFRKFAEVSRATIKGTFVVAAVQGAIGGIMFAIAGIQAPVFWAVIMGILSLIPAAGPALVWLPAAIFLFATGEVWQGVFLIVVGSLVVGLVDNILRPILVGRETKMPDYLVLIATLGGINAFGLAGFVIGPIITALFLVMWDMFASEFSARDSSEPVAEEKPPL